MVPLGFYGDKNVVDASDPCERTVKITYMKHTSTSTQYTLYPKVHGAFRVRYFILNCAGSAFGPFMIRQCVSGTT